MENKFTYICNNQTDKIKSVIIDCINEKSFNKLEKSLATKKIYINQKENLLKEAKICNNQYLFFECKINNLDYKNKNGLIKRIYNYIKLRVLPKIFRLTQVGNNWQEIIGYCSYLNFKIKFININQNSIICLTDISNSNEKPGIHYGAIIKISKKGLNNKDIKILKLRTMFSYSEYLYDILIDWYGLDSSGTKINDDPRISTIGKFLRKYWVDEIPQIINLIRGDIKIVGCRALSKNKLNLFPNKLKDLRMTVKPGLIPPYYYDNPVSLNEYYESEEKYLKLYKNNRYLTDLKYIIVSIYNVIIKGYRSE